MCGSIPNSAKLIHSCVVLSELTFFFIKGGFRNVEKNFQDLDYCC